MSAVKQQRTSCFPQDVAGQVLVVGTQQVGKYTLVGRLVHPAGTHSKQSGAKQGWQLDTKYYTAAVHIARSPPSQQACEQALTSQGLLLVFDASAEASFSAVSMWAEQLPGSVADIRLCVANKIDKIARQTDSTSEVGPELQRSNWLQAATTWCAENQFEYIEVSSTDRQLDDRLVWEEQQQGVCRVKQALEANYWPGLEMKQQSELPEPQAESSQGSSHTAINNGTHRCNEGASSSTGSSEADLDGFNAFQSAEEAELDQFDKMFGELRGMSSCVLVLSCIPEYKAWISHASLSYAVQPPETGCKIYLESSGSMQQLM